MKISVQGVSFAYSKKTALSEIDLEVHPGEILALVGPNGAGKSTLLRAISGALRPQKGVIYLDFQRVRDFSPRELARKLAMVEQGAQPSFDLTVQELVELGRIPHLGRLQGAGPADRAAVERALAWTNLSHLRGRKWSELSGGERQRALLAMAFAQEPEVLLLDEPTAHLDVAHQIELMQIIKGYAEQGGTVVMALHDLNLAASFAHRLALLHEGRLLACGQPREVLTPALLREAFGVQAVVRTNPLTGRIYVHFSLASEGKSKPKRGRLFIFGGGGSVEHLLPHLAEEFAVVVGVVAPLDSDYQMAQALGIPAITEAPFSPVSDESYSQLCRALAEAEAVVVGPTWFGPGNLRALEAVASCAGTKPVLIVDAENIKTRDFTGGRATALVQKLLEKGAQPVQEKNLFSALGSLFPSSVTNSVSQSAAGYLEAERRYPDGEPG